MARLLAYLLTALLLFQTLGQELLVVDYAINKASITRQYCVNKNRPALHCDGKCYLAKKLARAAERESKAPGAGLVKLKLEVVLPLRPMVPVALPNWPTAALGYARMTAPAVISSPLLGVFHPPAFRS